MSLTTKERGAYTRGRGGAYIRVSLYTGGGGLLTEFYGYFKYNNLMRNLKSASPIEK